MAVKEMRHTFRILTVSCLAMVLGLGVLYTYWGHRPIQKMKLEYAIDSLVKPHRLSETETSKASTKNAQEIPILLYHGILAGGNDGFSISKADFEAQMLALKRAGYTTITTGDYIDFVRGKRPVPDKTVMITFDDGRKDSFYRSDAMLKALGFQAVMFIASGYSLVDGSNYYLDESELEAMHKTKRWDIEAHSDYDGTNQIPLDGKGKQGNFFGNLKWLSDANRIETTQEYRARVKNELTRAKADLINFLGASEVSTFSFPFGDYAQTASSPELSKILLEEAQSIYSQAFIQFRKGEPYSSNYYNSGTFLSRRIEVDPDLSGEELVKLLGVSVAKPLPYVATMTDTDGWKDDWGKITIANKELVIEAEPIGTGATTYLDGTRQLTRYKANASFGNLQANKTSIKLVALYKNDDNYVGCNFLPDRVRVETVSSHKRTVALDLAMPSSYRDTGRLSIAIDSGPMVSCYADNKELVTAAISDSNLFGGPAIIIWQAQEGAARVVLRDFSVSTP